MTVEIVGRERLLYPGEIEFPQPCSTADDLVDRKALITVGHDLEARPERQTHGREPVIILRPMRLADLHLRAGEALGLRLQGIFDQGFLLYMQPAAFGRVKRATILGAAGKFPERQVLFLGAQVPERRIDSGKRQGSDGADRRRMRGKFHFVPDRLDTLGILADQQRHEMIGQQPHDGRTARTDRIAVAGTDGAV